MRAILFLTLRYLRYHRLKTTILLASLTITLLIPLAVHLLLREYDTRMLERSRLTPLVLGPRGSSFDLLLRALYFRPGRADTIPHRLDGEIRASGRAESIPLHVRYTAGGLPVVGTSLDYLTFRGLRVARGSAPAILGEAIAGAGAARELGLSPGSKLLTDQRNLYSLAGAIPVELTVSGILEPSTTADDRAIFVDVKTAWIMDGLGHGHEDVTSEEGRRLLIDDDGQNLTAGSGLVEHVTIDRKNVDEFHFHGDTDEFPLTALILVPRGEMERVLLKTEYRTGQDGLQVIAPLETTGELLSLVFRIKTLFDLHSLVVALATALLLILVVLLSLRLRARERDTLYKLGGARGMVGWLQATELLVLLGASLVLALGTALLVVALAPGISRLVS